MKRDGANTSLWQATADGFDASPKLAADQTFDVLVVGGGITGITTALLLQQAGKKVVVAESQNLCFGTTGGTTAHINSFFDTTYDMVEKSFGEHSAQLVAEACRESLSLFQKHVSNYQIDCGFEEKQAYLFAQTNEQVEQLNEIFAATQRAGAAVQWTDEIPASFKFLKALVFPGQAQIHPVRYVLALAKKFEEAGGVIIENCPVGNFEKNGETLAVESKKGLINTKALVYATHIPPGINLLHFRCAPYRSYALAAKLKNAQYPTNLLYDMYDPYHYFRTHTIDDETYLIAGGEDHKTGHEQNTEACFKNLEAHVRAHFEVDTITHQWSSQYFEPADGLAYIGHLPGNPDNVYVATGFGGNGITYSQIAAIILRDLITKVSSEYQELFAPGRIKPFAGFANFVKENADVVEQFISKRFSATDLQGFAELAPGEAKVIKYENEKMALYKDEQGVLHALNPVCTHAKCIVSWNGTEKSWDCPCHGARYSVDGVVLTGPARKNLEVIYLNELLNE